MPYISKNDDRREKLRNGDSAQSAGELNYQIFYYVKHSYFYNCSFTKNKIKEFINNFLGEKTNYQKYNDMTGCLIRCYKEIDRRLGIDVKYMLINIMEGYDYGIDKYEDKKCSENGDVE